MFWSYLTIYKGYIPGAEALSAVGDLVSKLKDEKLGLIYLLDRTTSIIENFLLNGFCSSLCLAVMGDSGRLYVAPDVVPVYKEMLPLATIITPNWFEVECVDVSTDLAYI